MKRTPAINHFIIAFLGFIALMLATRFYFTKNLQFAFLVWNIFLAYVPFSIAQYLFLNMTKKYLFFIGIIIWLLFFPNALYIVTDLLHLKLVSSVPKWFDVILLFSAGVVGLVFAFTSLFMIEHKMHEYFNPKKVAIIVFLFLLAGSFGVYLGRFLRWNSWNIINNPFSLMQDILERIFLPHEHLRTWSITFFLTVLFYLMYIFISKMPLMLLKLKRSVKI